MNILKQQKRFFIFLALFFLLSAIFFQVRVETRERVKIHGASIIYLPSGPSLKFITFGFNSLLADLVYLWAIQYYSDEAIGERFYYLLYIFSVISELDPHYVDPYRVGALIAWYEARRVDLALKILDLGIAKNPNQWILPFEAGHYAQLYKQDFKLAQYYFGLAKDIPGAPDITQRLYANAAFQTMDLRTAYQNWLEVYEHAQDWKIRNIALRHLYRTKATMDILTIEKALKSYQERYHRLPDNLEQLVRANILSEIPKDLDSHDYHYNPQTGEVKTPKDPWKR